MTVSFDLWAERSLPTVSQFGVIGCALYSALTMLIRQVVMTLCCISSNAGLDRRFNLLISILLYTRLGWQSWYWMQ